jgi:hypothetical protein
MICRCATPAIHAARAVESERYSAQQNEAYKDKQIAELKAKLDGMSPDNNRFQVEEIEEVGNFLVMKVLYPNCAKCAYEGNKVMVFEGVTIKDAFKWRKLDPHFRAGGLPPPINEAPPPVARFPASTRGWADAMEYAHSKPFKVTR